MQPDISYRFPSKVRKDFNIIVIENIAANHDELNKIISAFDEHVNHVSERTSRFKLLGLLEHLMAVHDTPRIRKLYRRLEYRNYRQLDSHGTYCLNCANKPATIPCTCGTHAWYCSKSCQDALAPVHDKYCRPPSEKTPHNMSEALIYKCDHKENINLSSQVSCCPWPIVRKTILDLIRNIQARHDQREPFKMFLETCMITLRSNDETNGDDEQITLTFIRSQLNFLTYLCTKVYYQHVDLIHQIVVTLTFLTNVGNKGSDALCVLCAGSIPASFTQETFTGPKFCSSDHAYRFANHYRSLVLTYVPTNCLLANKTCYPYEYFRIMLRFQKLYQWLMDRREYMLAHIVYNRILDTINPENIREDIIIFARGPLDYIYEVCTRLYLGDTCPIKKLVSLLNDKNLYSQESERICFVCQKPGATSCSCGLAIYVCSDICKESLTKIHKQHCRLGHCLQ
jgi:hypothetical protein